VKQEELNGQEEGGREEMRTQEKKDEVWNRKANGAAIDGEKKILYFLECKRDRCGTGLQAPCGDAGGPASETFRGPALSTFGARSRTDPSCSTVDMAAALTPAPHGPPWPWRAPQGKKTHRDRGDCPSQFLKVVFYDVSKY
jgi:hypothetical protein